MTSKLKKPAVPEAEKYPRTTVICESGPSVDEKGRNYAKLLTSAELAAYRVISKVQPKKLADEIDTPTLLEALRDQAAVVQTGDLSHAEAMLINQASSLQALFVRLTERAMVQDQMPNLEGFMKLALRAQSQCRATLETLATIKNPPIVYARQANVTSGPQQINNGTEPSQVREFQHEQNKLLDARATGETIGSHSTLETVGKVDRAKVCRRKSQGSEKS